MEEEYTCLKTRIFILKGGFIMLESKFQYQLKKELEKMFPGCIVNKNECNQRQGFPDLLILYKDKWACLECKKESTSSIRPNQRYYINLLNDMSFAKFIYPENKEAVLNALQQAFST